MSDTAFQTQYRDEFVAAFEQHESLLREVVTTEGIVKGGSVIFQVAGSGSASAVTRGVNGMIPARSDDLTQNTCTLTEWHDLVRKSQFNIFASQGNQRAIMQMSTMAVINRKVDELIINQLATGTVAIGSSSAIPNVSLMQNGRVKLSNASVPMETGYVTLLCQPSFIAYLEQAPEFAHADYVNLKPYAGESSDWTDKKMVYKWKKFVIIEHPNLPGKGTSSEKNYLFHKSAIGHSMGSGEVDTTVGYNDEQQYSFARVSAFMGAKLLQNAGVVVITCDGSAYA